MRLLPSDSVLREQGRCGYGAVARARCVCVCVGVGVYGATQCKWFEPP